jgi:cytochrome P450
MDFVQDFAMPLPILVMAKILGVPPEDFQQFKRWCDEAASNSSPTQDGDLMFRRDAFVASRENWGSDEVLGYFAELARKRRTSPGDDLLSVLAAAEIDGKPLSDRELAANCFQLLLAGNETTTNMLACAMSCLDGHRAMGDQLAADGSLIPGMLEEALRYRPSVHGVVRLTTRDVEVGGRVIPEGELVMAWLAAGNRDPRQFSEPNRFDITRNPNRHLAFGQGIHFCIGAPLARLEAAIAFQVLVERLKDIEIVPGYPDRAVNSATIYGYPRLPVRSLPRISRS